MPPASFGLSGEQAALFYSIKVVLTDSTSYHYNKLVIATGAEPFIPPIPGYDLKNVTGFKTEDHLHTIQAVVDGGLKKAVIIGAGAIGIELAQALVSTGTDVDLLTYAIQKESTIEDLTGLSYSTQPYQSFFPAASGVVLAAEDILRKNNDEACIKKH